MSHTTRQIISFSIIVITVLFSVPIAHAAFFSYNTDTTEVTPGEQFDINIHLDTESVDTNAADFVGIFDRAIFTVDSIQFNTLYQDTFETIDTDTGTISLAGSASSIDQGFNGADTFATLTVTPHVAGIGDFTIECDRSAIWEKGDSGTNALDCSKLQNLTFTVVDSAASNCIAPIPSAPINVYTESGPANGQVTLFWDPVTPITQYGINYGTSPGFYSIGAANVGKFPQFTISNLVPNNSYYFTVYAVNDCAISPISFESTAVAATSDIPGVDLTPEVIFVPLENQPGRPLAPSPTATPSATPLVAVEETKDESFLVTINPLFILIAIGGAVFLVALYIVGKNRDHHEQSSLTTPLQPHHADPVKEHSTQSSKGDQSISHDTRQNPDTPLHQGTPKEGG